MSLPQTNSKNINTLSQHGALHSHGFQGEAFTMEQAWKSKNALAKSVVALIDPLAAVQTSHYAHGSRVHSDAGKLIK